MNTLKKITDWYFTKKAMPYWCVLFLDCFIVMFSGIVCSYFVVGGMGVTNSFWQIVRGQLCAMPLYALSFHCFHTYRGIIRYSSYVDFYRIGKASLMGCVLTYGLGRVCGMFFSERVIQFPNVEMSVILFGLSTFAMWIVRLAVKASFESFNTDNASLVAIYGTQNGGTALANSIMSVTDKKYLLKCFISDGQDMADSYLMGKKVYLNGKGIADKLKDHGVTALLVSPLKSKVFRDNKWMIDELAEANIKIMMMPVAEEWDGKSELSYNQLHEVEIEDLLPRDEITVDMDAIGEMLTGKSVLITGAAGSIGSEMVRQIAPYKPADLILVDQAETPMHDMRLWASRALKGSEQFGVVRNGETRIETIVVSITNEEYMEKIFREHRPDYVFHAAAYKHVPMMEDNPAMAVQNNIYGTRVIADLAVKYGTKKFVMISTDKAVNPTNVMGCSKRICEIYCQSLNQAIVEGKVKGLTQFVTTRFGNVLGSNGSVIPIFKEQIKKGGPVTVTHKDIMRYFMLIPEACRLVLEAGTMGKGGEIFVFDMGKPVKIVDLAKTMISLSGAKNIDIKFTGLREGEKLYEEVLDDAEGSKPTVHPKIKVAKVREYDYATALKNEEHLMEVSHSLDDMKIVKVMKEIVPEYKSRVSKYEVLDK